MDFHSSCDRHSFLKRRLLQTLKLFAIHPNGACPLGLAICFGSMSRIKPVSAFFKLLIWVVRGTPLMIQLLIIYFFSGTRIT